jgi:hypothetical protein
MGLSSAKANFMRAHGRGGGSKRLMCNDPSLVPAGIETPQTLRLKANLMCEFTIPVLRSGLYEKAFERSKGT